MTGEHEFLPPSGGGISTIREDHGSHHEPGSARMTNADFRKLVMTPRSGHGATALGALGAGNTPSLGGGTVPSGGVGKTRAGPSRAAPGIGGQTPVQSGNSASSEKAEKAEKRKKKKSFYAKLKRQEDDKMAELAAKYRDRAKERRDGGFPGEKVEAGELEVPADPKGERGTDVVPAPHTNSSSGYRAVAPDVKSSRDAAERRRQLISESKFLGGDMEHTHLVKGLDFALLQKVRSEICHREKTAGEEEEVEKHSSTVEDKRKKEEKGVGKDDGEDHVGCRTVLAKNVLRAAFRTDMPERNELFFPGRMAYVIDLEEEFGQADDAEANADSDIPTTTIRSKADVQGNLAHQQAVSMSANDIVINKLAQILSYLRAAGSRGKKKKKDKLIPRLPNPKSDTVATTGNIKNPSANLPIYDDADEYVPSYEKQSSRLDGKRHSRSDRDRRETRRDDRGRHHREREWDDRSRRDKDRDSRRHGSSGRHDSKHTPYFDKKDSHEEDKSGFSGQDKDLLKNLLKREEVKSKKADKEEKGKQMLSTENDVYAECYPGMEMNDAIEDSDDEVDYTKMDLGNKKGPVGRWDFDTAEEYADYMSQKEAMPKAAFQYGVKMTEGRKTRGKVGVKNEKAKLDKEWNKISALIDKRKGSGMVAAGGSSAKKRKFY